MSSAIVGADETVTVVIPAYNAAATIDETLRSVRAQTYGKLDIIVVDDGSSDETAAIVQRHAAVDRRVRLEHQANAGVAAARNRGWQIGRGDLIAFVDADDLWSAEKIERQLAALKAQPDAGLVYSWYVIIDEKSRIILRFDQPAYEGNVLKEALRENFVGNGSSVLVTREVLEATGGFDPGLRGANAGGCEDLLFYARVAERYPFALAPGYLVGYRYIAGNMSSDLAKMLRSWILAADQLTRDHPERKADADAGIDRFARWLVRRSFELSEPRHLPPLFKVIARRSPTLAVAIFASEVPKAIRDFRWRPFKPAYQAPPSERFQIGSPDAEPIKP